MENQNIPETETKPNQVDKKEIPPPPHGFCKVICDFVSDMLTTFPEYKPLIDKWWHSDNDVLLETDTITVFNFCIRAYPERFFDILYKNADMFKDDSTINTEFLPGIVFKQLWSADISDHTKTSIWNYLQLVLFSVIESVHDGSAFGDTASMFENISEEELKKQLTASVEQMQEMFTNQQASDTNNKTSNDNSKEGLNASDLPRPEQIHEHLNGMLKGKLGGLAMELAEDVAASMNVDINSDVDDVSKVYSKLLQNPAAMMNMVKTIGSKIDTKIKAGELKESELMSEGMDLLSKMKDMPGMGNMQHLFSQMGLGGKGGKMNTGAMAAKMSENLKTAQLRESIKEKAQKNAQAKMQQQQQPQIMPPSKALTDDELIKIFSTGEKVERTPRQQQAPDGAKKKKNKKGKK